MREIKTLIKSDLNFKTRLIGNELNINSLNIYDIFSFDFGGMAMNEYTTFTRSQSLKLGH